MESVLKDCSVALEAILEFGSTFIFIKVCIFFFQVTTEIIVMGEEKKNRGIEIVIVLSTVVSNYRVQSPAWLVIIHAMISREKTAFHLNLNLCWFFFSNVVEYWVLIIDYMNHWWFQRRIASSWNFRKWWIDIINWMNYSAKLWLTSV